MALCKTDVNMLYSKVIEDVIQNINNIFSDEEIDDEIRHNLKTLWETKLLANEANCKSVKHGVKQKIGTLTPSMFRNSTTNVIQPKLGNEMIPIQLTLPMQPTVNSTTRVVTIYVPANAVNQPELRNLLTGPIITATMGLPTPVACSILQQHINTAFQNQQQQQMVASNITMPQMDGKSDEVCPRSGPAFSKVDGAADTSDSESDGFVTEISCDEESNDDEENLYLSVNSLDEVLNSDDDVTEEESDDQLDTDNIIVCQYDKISRVRNKWKLHLKHGVMKVDGEDFVFHDLIGDAEW